MPKAQSLLPPKWRSRLFCRHTLFSGDPFFERRVDNTTSHIGNSVSISSLSQSLRSICNCRKAAHWLFNVYWTIKKCCKMKTWQYFCGIISARKTAKSEQKPCTWRKWVCIDTATDRLGYLIFSNLWALAAPALWIVQNLGGYSVDII